MHEFISYRRTEWYLFLSDSASGSAQCVFGRKNLKLFSTSQHEPPNKTIVVGLIGCMKQYSNINNDDNNKKNNN